MLFMSDFSVIAPNRGCERLDDSWNAGRKNVATENYENNGDIRAEWRADADGENFERQKLYKNISSIYSNKL